MIVGERIGSRLGMDWVNAAMRFGLSVDEQLFLRVGVERIIGFSVFAGDDNLL